MCKALGEEVDEQTNPEGEVAGVWVDRPDCAVALDPIVEEAHELAAPQGLGGDEIGEQRHTEPLTCGGQQQIAVVRAPAPLNLDALGTVGALKDPARAGGEVAVEQAVVLTQLGGLAR